MRILEAHWVFALATVDPEHPAPYATPLFYALESPLGRGVSGPALLFASSPRARHSSHVGGEAERGVPAAATIYLESEEVGALRGAQLRGRLSRIDPQRASGPLARYLERHPVAGPALEGGGHALYRFEIEWAKLTDNRLGFGRHREVRFVLPSL